MLRSLLLWLCMVCAAVDLQQRNHFHALSNMRAAASRCCLVVLLNLEGVEWDATVSILTG